MTHTFNWKIDTKNYLHNKKADKIKVKQFITSICGSLDKHVGEEWENIRNTKNNHPCHDLVKRKSNDAQRLNKHLEKINERFLDGGEAEIEPFQIKITTVKDKPFRVFGYIKDHIFYLVFLDPDHQVYKQ